MFFLVEQDYYRNEYYCLKATLIGIGMVALPLCILFSVGGSSSIGGGGVNPQIGGGGGVEGDVDRNYGFMAGTLLALYCSSDFFVRN